MSKGSNKQNSKSLFLINFGIKISKLGIYCCLVYFSYFFLNTTQEGQVVIKNVEIGIELGKNIFITPALHLGGIMSTSPIILEADGILNAAYAF